MHRFGLAVLLVATSVACEPSKSTTPPEPSPAASKPEPEPELEPEPEPEPAPEPEEPEESEFATAVLSQGGFEARDLNCTLATPTRGAGGYITAGLVDPEVDAALDACAPKGAAIAVDWAYVSGQAGNINVVAKTSKQANCVAAAMGKVRAGVEGECSAILLIGDPAAAAAAYEAR